MKILIVEDDFRIANNLAQFLRSNNHVVEIAYDGETGYDLAEIGNYDLIILDLSLPKMDGITVCQKLRKNQCQSLILMLTARDTNLDQVTGLDAGADDYIIKPFDLQLLLARIRALLRRNNNHLNTLFTWGDLVLDPNKYEVKYQNNLVNLSPKEYQLLELLFRNCDRTLTKEIIIDQLWSMEEIPQEETVKAHIKGIRKKLKLAGLKTNIIENIYGVGYRLNSYDCP
ncbi:response regulator transcription factor [Cyanobacterium sp. Dongsha4]|uniref:response regulator transcription factor n=1 Tax=Cyanobacterium sp. DS4 TaxID=2878255 RepID=UPI002E80FD3F|nr:response regulator transcription factor [Cyanobacterium sp. Dongsha4]WVK99715.1 response regulator transcription factor [Cyanobacterium sp. Dongsha4]